MSILTGEEIKREVRSGRVVIDPFFQENVKEASIELLLGSEFGVVPQSSFPISSREFTAGLVNWQKVDLVLDLPPQQSIIGKTKEKITLPFDIAGWITGRGRFTLLGLSLHISVGFVQPGTRAEHLFFLISNHGSAPVSLYVDSKICQLILFRLGEKATVGEPMP